jgi:hypothetical protein
MGDFIKMNARRFGLLTGVVATLALGSASASAQSVIAAYDAVTGNVSMDVSGPITVIGIGVPGQTLMLTGVAGDVGSDGPIQDTDESIAWFNANGLAEGVWDVGNIVTPGTDIGLLEGSYTIKGGDTVALTIVPEPATMALLGIGGLALIRRRRAA